MSRTDNLRQVAAIVFGIVAGIAFSESLPAQQTKLNSLIQREIDRGVIVGAQSAVGSRDGAVRLREYGVLAHGSRRSVNENTLFCIGSCSKPFASACLLSLAESGAIDLDKPIDHWLTEFSHLKLVDGTASPRAPTLRELLAHQGGIYSQKRGPMSPEQTRAIRDFRLTLAESVDIISGQPLLAQPGSAFAYSGAGYCVLGRVAEVATNKSFEEILQERIATPLQLSRTSFFPAPDETNTASGGTRQRGRVITHPQTPHLLGKNLVLPLIGGSLYSTAEETARFARMILNKGIVDEQVVLSPQIWSELTRQQYDGQPYGLGWTLQFEQGQLSSMQHNGALFGNRSMMFLDMARGTFTVVHWTLADAGGVEGQQLSKQFQHAARQAMTD